MHAGLWICKHESAVHYMTPFHGFFSGGVEMQPAWVWVITRAASFTERDSSLLFQPDAEAVPGQSCTAEHQAKGALRQTQGGLWLTTILPNWGGNREIKFFFAITLSWMDWPPSTYPSTCVKMSNFISSSCKYLLACCIMITSFYDTEEGEQPDT